MWMWYKRGFDVITEARIIHYNYTEEKRKVILQEKWIFLPKEKSHIIRKKVIWQKLFCPKSGFHLKKWLFFRIIWGKKPFFMSNGPKWLFKNDFFFGPFDIKNGFDAKWKNMKKSFYDKNGFFFILYGKNMTFLEKNHFWPQNHFSFFSV